MGLHLCKNMCLEYSFLGIPPIVADFFFNLSLWSEKEHMHEVNAGTDWGVFTYGGYIYGRIYTRSDWNYRLEQVYT